MGVLDEAVRIGIDGRALRSFVQGAKAGIGRYTWEICQRLDQLLPAAEFFVYSPVPIELPVVSSRWHLRLEPSVPFRFLKSVLWSRYRCGRLIRHDDIDVFWGAGSFLPRLPGHIKTVLTVYDLTYIFAPESMRLSHQMAFKLFFDNDFRRAGKITTISRGSADRLLERFGRTVDAVVYPSLFNDCSGSEAEIVSEVVNGVSVKSPFILAVGTLEPRKNIILLIRTLEILKRGGKFTNHTLVLVGRCGWKFRSILAEVRRHEWVVVLGFVDDNALITLYRSCSIFAFTSVYEGFGMPVLEARSFGATVVTIDTPELREAGGPDTIYADPDIGSLAQALLRAGGPTRPRHDAGLPVEWPTWEDGARILAGMLVAQ